MKSTRLKGIKMKRQQDFL